MRFVTDTSPLVAFSGVGQLGLLRLCCGKAAVPVAVRTEIVNQGIGWIEARDAQEAIKNGRWLVTVEVGESEVLRGLRATLGAGEAECIEFARVTGAEAIIDDFAARGIAARFGVRCCGTLGILARAKRAGCIKSVGPLLGKMRDNGIRFSNELIEKYLADLGESL